MEVITMESEAFREWKEMYMVSQETIQRQSEIITASKIGLLDAKQVAELTGYDEKTIRIKKTEIGYITMGKNVKFKIDDVQAWINKYYRAPKPKRS